LATGDYRLKFWRCGDFGDNVLDEYYEDAETLAEATPVSVTDRSNTPNVNAQLDLAGSISGALTDNAGGPLEGVCVRTFDSSGASTGYDETGPDGRYLIGGLDTGSYRVKFSECHVHARPAVLTEFYDDADTLAQATPVAVTAGAATTSIDAQLATEPAPVARAAISGVSVKGPAKIRRNEKAVYRVTVTNSGSAKAKGVELEVKGRGVRFGDSVGAVRAGSARTFRAKLRPQQLGKIKVSFKVTSDNAGANRAVRRLTVKR
jgi:hypothetical protein